MEQPARQRIARCCDAVCMRLVERSAGRHAIAHIQVLEEGVTVCVPGIIGQGRIQRAASLDLEGAEARADVTTTAERRGRGRDQIAAWAGVDAVGSRRHFRRGASMIDATPKRVARHVGDRAASLCERRARGRAMRHIGVLGVRVGAVCLDLGAVALAVEGRW